MLSGFVNLPGHDCGDLLVAGGFVHPSFKHDSARYGLFYRGGNLRPWNWANIGIHRNGAHRRGAIRAHCEYLADFSSVLAVSLLDEVWTVQNVIGTCLVILGVVILSSDRATQGQWRKSDIAYPVLGAMAFGISTTLRKSGLNQFPNPLLGAAVTVGTAFLVLCAIAHLGFGRCALQFNHQGSGWLFAAALLNAGAILSLFSRSISARSLKSSR